MQIINTNPAEKRDFFYAYWCKLNIGKDQRGQRQSATSLTAVAATIQIIDLYGRITRTYTIPETQKERCSFFEGLSSAVYEVVWINEKDLLGQRMLVY